MGPKWDGEKADDSQSWREIMRADGHHLFILLSIYFVLSLQAVWPQLSDEKTKKENSKKKELDCLFRAQIKLYHLAKTKICLDTQKSPERSREVS